MDDTYSFFKSFFSRFKKNRSAYSASLVFIFIALLGIYAPFFACSKPFLVKWKGNYYAPFFRFLFFKGFYTKPLDLFFNVLMFTLPPTVLALVLFRKRNVRRYIYGIFGLVQSIAFITVNCGVVKNPSGGANLQMQRSAKIAELQQSLTGDSLIAIPRDFRTWDFEREFMSDYDKLGMLLKRHSQNTRHEVLSKYAVSFESKEQRPMPTLKYLEEKHDLERLRRLANRLSKLEDQRSQVLVKWDSAVNAYEPCLLALARAEHDCRIADFMQTDDYESKRQELLAIQNASEDKRREVLMCGRILEEYVKTENAIAFIKDKQKWLVEELEDMHIILKPLLRNFHWEDDTGMAGDVNKHIPWWEISRSNGRDELASLLFGIRICLVVGFIGSAIALFLGIAIGLISGYFGGKTDMICSRLSEIWEMMPVLFILLLIVSVSQVKSLFANVLILGLFSWTGFARYIRAEVLRERALPYVLAARSMGYTNVNIMLRQILPNVFSSIIALVPFTVMAMISSEAGMTFLGLGEENTTSWGALMREGVDSFPSDSYLLWPPATMLTIFLISIALTGDGIRDALDPRLKE